MAPADVSDELSFVYQICRCIARETLEDKDSDLEWTCLHFRHIHQYGFLAITFDNNINHYVPACWPEADLT